jgi:acetoin utilization protein AcuB
MRVFELMTNKVTTIPSTAAAGDAWQLMQTARIRQLIVKDGSQVVGVLSESDAGGPHGAALRAGATVADLMDPHVVAVKRQDTVRKVANLMRGRGVPCLPVIEDGRLVGLITDGDLLALLGRGVERPDHEARAALHHRVPHRKVHAPARSW